MGIMFLTVKNLYIKAEITEKGLNNAVRKGWITPEEKNRIMEIRGW